MSVIRLAGALAATVVLLGVTKCSARAAAHRPAGSLMKIKNMNRYSPYLYFLTCRAFRWEEVRRGTAAPATPASGKKL
ncbi:MAG: hypothetical protein N2378_16870 [Chloroflexaceae bacterium]|nr:hypothetical protein [Chloroflexaceae bacterium]